MKGMKKTNYIMLASAGVHKFAVSAVYRRVWEKDGRYFIKINGETKDVTFAKDSFIED